MVEKCEWNDAVVEIEQFVKLARLAFLQKNHQLVVRCITNAQQLKTTAAIRQAAIHKNPVQDK